MASLQEEITRLLPFERFQNPPPVVSVLRLSGIIATGSSPLRRGGINLQSLAAPIERAFKPAHLKAVALAINSPGGSPVQSSLVYQRIRAHAAERKVPVLAFAEDVAASGGYWLACAADEIFVDESSIVGSIGVIFASFGLQDMIGRYGIERRVHVSGIKKSTLDPFRPENRDDVLRLRATQSDVHDAFKEIVRERRAGKLASPEDELFSGEYWTGKRAVEHGLVDGIGEIRSVLRERYGERVRLVQVGSRRGGWLWRRLGAGGYAPEDWVAAASQALEERGLWARYGL